MAVLSRSIYVLAIIDALIIAFISFVSGTFVADYYPNLFLIVGLFVLSNLFLLGLKGFYKIRKS